VTSPLYSGPTNGSPAQIQELLCKAVGTFILQPNSLYSEFWLLFDGAKSNWPVLAMREHKVYSGNKKAWPFHPL
jgi:hypothetical protein